VGDHGGAAGRLEPKWIDDDEIIGTWQDADDVIELRAYRVRRR